MKSKVYESDCVCWMELNFGGGNSKRISVQFSSRLHRVLMVASLSVCCWIDISLIIHNSLTSGLDKYFINHKTTTEYTFIVCYCIAVGGFIKVNLFKRLEFIFGRLFKKRKLELL